MAEVVTAVQVPALVVSVEKAKALVASVEKAKAMAMARGNSGSRYLKYTFLMGRCCTCPRDLYNLRRSTCLPIYCVIFREFIR